MIKYLTKALIQAEFNKHIWPTSYIISEDSDNANRCLIEFTHARILLSELERDGLSWCISVQPNIDTYFGLASLGIYAIRPRIDSMLLTQAPVVYNPFIYSLEGIKVDLQNLCIVLQSYFLDVLGGNYSLIVEYLQAKQNQSGQSLG
jgi:hypothetical protein